MSENQVNCFYWALARLKKVPAYSEEERLVLKELLSAILANPERVHSFWVDIPGYLKQYGPLRDIFTVALKFLKTTKERPGSQSEVALFAGCGRKINVRPAYMAYPGLN